VLQIGGGRAKECRKRIVVNRREPERERNEWTSEIIRAKESTEKGQCSIVEKKRDERTSVKTVGPMWV